MKIDIRKKPHLYLMTLVAVLGLAASVVTWHLVPHRATRVTEVHSR